MKFCVIWCESLLMFVPVFRHTARWNFSLLMAFSMSFFTVAFKVLRTDKCNLFIMKFIYFLLGMQISLFIYLFKKVSCCTPHQNPYNHHKTATFITLCLSRSGCGLGHFFFLNWHLKMFMTNVPTVLSDFMIDKLVSITKLWTIKCQFEGHSQS